MNDAMRERVIAEAMQYREQVGDKTCIEVRIRTGEPAIEIVKHALLERILLVALPTHGRDGPAGYTAVR